jgi:uncharacterized protein
MQIYLPLAEIALSLPMLIGLGAAVGVLSGLFGIGGGFILTPMLIFLGVPPLIAVGTGACQVTASSVTGALGHWRRGNVDLRLGVILVASGVMGVTGGIKLQQWLKAFGQLDLFTTMTYVVMLGVIGALMLIESARAIWQTRATSHGRPRRRGAHHSWIQRLPLKQRFRVAKLYMSMVPAVGIGAFVGWLTAIMGVGGGFVLVPALIYLLRVPTRIAFGTSAFQIIFVTAYATLLHATQNFSVDLALAAPLIVGGVAGAQIGVGLGQRMKAEMARLFLASLVVAVAIRMGLTLVLAPTEAFSFEASD